VALDIKFKPERHPGRWILLIILILLLAAAAWYGYKWYTTGELPISIAVAKANSSVDESDVSYDDIKNYTVDDQHPRYISIPSLQTEKARIYAVGLDANNMIKAPANIHDVSWYDKSGTPGEGGVILMNGHNEGINKNGAFHGLDKLVKGDKITLERGDGEVIDYLVVENNTLTLDEISGDGIAILGKSVNPGTEGLNIITFDGKWVPRLGTFDHRTIIRAIIDTDK
jgi:sortase (surface protein transpeptidase)